jgi:hypothetical protein
MTVANVQVEVTYVTIFIKYAVYVQIICVIRGK